TGLLRGADTTIQLDPPGSIEGVVVDERGSPVTSFTVGIESFVGGPDSSQARMGGPSRSVDDPGGTFVLGGLEPGKYVVSASAPDRPIARSARVEVDGGRATRHVRIVLAQGATLRGRVVDADTRDALGGAMVSLDAISYSGVSVSKTTSDAGGAFRLSI